MNATQLFVGKAQEMKPSGLWFCAECRGRYPHPTVHGSEAAAEACCRPTMCHQCKANEARPGWSSCDSCSKIVDVEREMARFEKAEKIAAVNYDGPVVCDDADHNDGYFENVADFTDWWQPPLPGYVWACTSKPCCHIDLDSVLEDSSQDAHEEFEIRDLEGVDKLRADIENFNTLNARHQVWEPNYKLAVLLGDLKEAQ